MKPWKKKSIAGLALASIVTAVVLFFKIWTHGLSNPEILIVHCPARPQSELRLVKSGLTDREVFMYVKPSPSDKTKPITSLDFDGLYSFEELRWTKDGLLDVITIRLLDGEKISPFAFDFSTMRALLPDWQDVASSGFRSSADWKEFEGEVGELAEEHGGLSDNAISSEALRSTMRKLHWWEAP